MIKAVIFDLWNVILTKGFSVNRVLQEKFNIPDYKDYRARCEKATELREWGSFEHMAGGFLNYFGIAATEKNIELVVDTYKKGLSNVRVIPGMKDILQNLRNNYKLALVSNTNNLESRFFDELGLRDLFDAVVLSYEVSKIKPDKEIFDEVSDRLSIALQDCLFIDDVERNTSIAEEYGITTIRFRDVERLKKSLHDLSVKF